MRDLFPGFYKRSDEELPILWQEGIFVFDTNMLLNVYRYKQKTRARYIEILDMLKERKQLWIPYQVAYEYQDRRLNVIQGQLDAYTDVATILQTTAQKLANSLGTYENKHEFIHAEKIIKDINDVINKAKTTVTQSKAKDKKEYEALKKRDTLLEKLDDLFHGNIGNAYTREKLSELYTQSQKRVELRIPPGWEDEGKKGHKRYGDIILWFQMIDYAQSQKKPIIFVTDDGKKDWWTQDSQGKLANPLPELIQEMFVEADVLLHMYQGYNFIEAATKFFKFEEKSDIIKEAKEVTERNIVEASQVKHRAPSRLYAGDVIQRIVQDWLESTYFNSQLFKDYHKSSDFPRLDFLIKEPNGTEIGVEIRYFQALTAVYQIVSNRISIMGREKGIDKMIAFVVTGSFSDAISILEILENKISIPENVSLIIGHIEPDFQFYQVATLPKES